MSHRRAVEPLKFHQFRRTVTLMEQRDGAILILLGAAVYKAAETYVNVRKQRREWGRLHGEIAELRRYYAEHRTAPEELLNEVTNRPKSSAEQLIERMGGHRSREQLIVRMGGHHTLVDDAIAKRVAQVSAIRESYDMNSGILVVAALLIMAATLYFGWFTHN